MRLQRKGRLIRLGLGAVLIALAASGCTAIDSAIPTGMNRGAVNLAVRDSHLATSEAKEMIKQMKAAVRNANAAATKANKAAKKAKASVKDPEEAVMKAHLAAVEAAASAAEAKKAAEEAQAALKKTLMLIMSLSR
jgi:GTP-binding protein EngB required for normal cell division